ncbi:MAG: cell wall-active antibiotics response protein LiaF [Dehalococcoidia bacterium]|nr:cell wall-active antibiotics response protein LiaF [Dehalococcoidia bacterium]
MWTILFGLYFLALGGILALHNLGVFSLRENNGWGVAWALLLVVLGVGIMARGGARRIWRCEHGHGRAAGDVRIGDSPFDLKEATYEIGMGRLTVDLTRATVASGEATARAHAGMGSLQVLLPEALAVDINAAVGIGDLHVLEQTAQGFGRELHVTSPDYAQAERRVRLDLDVGIGEIVVRRAGEPPAG